MKCFETFKEFNEDVAVNGEVTGQGDVTFPNTNDTNVGSGDSFDNILGINYDKNKLISKILKVSDDFKSEELVTKSLDDLYTLWQSLNESEESLWRIRLEN